MKRRQENQAPNTALQRTRGFSAAQFLWFAGFRSAAQRLSPRRSPLNAVALGARAIALAVLANVSICASVALAQGKADTVEAMRRFRAAHPGVVSVGGEVKPPKLIHRVRIDFPDKVKKNRRDLSALILEVVITETGKVADPTFVMSAHPDLEPFILKAIRQWRYEPARRKGKAVPVFLTITVGLEPSRA